MASFSNLAALALCGGLAAGTAVAQEDVAGWAVRCGDAPVPDEPPGCFLSRDVPGAESVSLVVVLTEFFDEARGALWLRVEDVILFGLEGKAAITLGGEAYEVAASTQGNTSITDDGEDSFTVVKFPIAPAFVASLRDGGSFGFSFAANEFDAAGNAPLTYAGDVPLDGLAEAWSAAAESQGWQAN